MTDIMTDEVMFALYLIVGGLIWGVIFGCVGMSCANHKNRSGAAWFAICFVIGIIGLLLIAVLPPLSKEEALYVTPKRKKSKKKIGKPKMKIIKKRTV